MTILIVVLFHFILGNGANKIVVELHSVGETLVCCLLSFYTFYIYTTLINPYLAINRGDEKLYMCLSQFVTCIYM